MVRGVNRSGYHCDVLGTNVRSIRSLDNQPILPLSSPTERQLAIKIGAVDTIHAKYTNLPTSSAGKSRRFLVTADHLFKIIG